MAITGECDLQNRYRGKVQAERYVCERFSNELGRLLHERQLVEVQGIIERVQPQRILEIAPGPGRLTRGVRWSGLLACLEFNEGMIEQGRLACSNGLWVRGNGFQLPFASAFDLVYSFRFVRHFRRADRDRLYEEIRRVLRPRGYFVMDAVNERVSKPLREAEPEAYPIYDKLYRPEELGQELAQAGFELLTLQPVNRYWSWQARSQVFLGPRANWLNRLMIRTLERLPRRDGLEWIVTCRRA
jgi:SAM-dependent methyltransferase